MDIKKIIENIVAKLKGAAALCCAILCAGELYRTRREDAAG